MKPQSLGIGILVLLVVAFVISRQAFLTVDEPEQVIITQFGEYKRTIQDPGLHMKVPFIQTVHRFDGRILSSDAPKAEYLSQDKKRLVADPVTRWRIVDPLRFYMTVRDEPSARARLDDLVFSELRREVASHDFGVVIGARRKSIMESVTNTARERAREFGIEVIDVQIKRADLPTEVQMSVFQRMEAERQRESMRYRAEGDEDSAKLKAEADRERTVLLAEARQTAERLRGEGDATAARIYADAYGRDPEFYSFTRSLHAYERVITNRTTLLLPAEMDLFRYLGSSGLNSR
jgi:modulator of FtsH protease HflC